MCKLTILNRLRKVKKKRKILCLHGNNHKTKGRCKRQPLDFVVHPQGSVVHQGEQPQHDQETNNI